ncbi:hypothetical protein [Aureivirga sp. CE67]|nr:hypothetical protein [Aureivirga sp. CE67]
MRFIITTFLILWTMNQAVAQNTTQEHKDSLNTMVEKYYDLEPV